MCMCTCKPVHVQEGGKQKERRVRAAGPGLQHVLLPQRVLACV